MHEVISALYRDVRSAETAIRELREIRVPLDNISVISRDEDHTAVSSTGAGVAREVVGDEGLAYRASTELPNYEDLPTTNAEQTGHPIVMDDIVPPDEPLGGSDRLGIVRDADMVRRNEAQTNADEDIYSDFPDEPGGVDPESPAAVRAGAGVQEKMAGRTGAGGNAATGAAAGGLAGLLVGLGALAIPGIGPVLAAGPLLGALGGLVAGSAAGGLLGALSSVGVPEEYAREYAAQIEQGQTLVSVRTDNITRDAVERILTAHGGEAIH